MTYPAATGRAPALAPLFVAAVIASCSLGCSQDRTPADLAGDDGSGSGGVSGVGGLSASGGMPSVGGLSASGGAPGVGGQSGTGGEVIIEALEDFVCGNASYFVHAPDADGDGYRDSTAWDYPVTPVECILQNGGVESSLPPDCDDTDPNVYHTGFVNADGDEHGDVVLPVCYGAVLPPELAVRVPDCDDTDPALGRWFLQDADEDGFGAGRTCAVGPALGVSEVGGDCDDEDAAVHPNGADIPGDDADSNCDGGDGVYIDPDDDLSSLPEPEVLESLPPEEVCGATAGLHATFYWLEHYCLWDVDDEFPSDATALAYAAFTNEGGEATPAALAVLESELDTEWSLELPIAPLEPGEVTPLYALGKLPVTLSIRFQLPEVPDCESVVLSTVVPHECVTK